VISAYLEHATWAEAEVVEEGGIRHPRIAIGARAQSGTAARLLEVVAQVERALGLLSLPLLAAWQRC